MLQLDLVQTNARLDGWIVKLEPLEGGGEVYHLPTRTAIVDPTQCGLRMALRHGLSHIRLRHMYQSGDLTEEQCDQADAEAEFVSEVMRKVDAHGRRPQSRALDPVE